MSLVSPTPPASEPSRLVADGLRKVYESRQGWFKPAHATAALDGVSLSLASGEILGVVGESGCGKSTLAKVMLGLTEADAGTLSVDGRTLFGPGATTVPSHRRGIQMVFQDPFSSLDPRMKVRDIVGEGLVIAGAGTRAEISDEVRCHLALVGLGDEAMDKYPHQFSGGQRQRICIARAVILRPKFLIADEAVSALDVSIQLQILNLLLDLRRRLGLAILFISHDIGVIEYLCDRVVVMYRGRVVEENGTAALVDRPLHPYTQLLIGARPSLERAVAVPAAARTAAAEPAFAGACAFFERCPRRLERCRDEAPALAATRAARVACFNPLIGSEE